MKSKKSEDTRELDAIEATLERVSPGALEIYAMFVGQDEAIREAEEAMAAYGVLEQPIVSSAATSN